MPHPVVLQELRLLEDVLRALAEEPGRDDAAEESIVRELERVRALLLSGEEQKDRLALLEQWDRGSALLRQLRASRATPRVNRSSPYFAHMRLLEDGRTRDVCLGRATCVRSGVRIVDWRNAPISRLFYRYRQGESYEEELAGRVVSGEVAARRTVAIRGGLLERVDAPEGSWVRAPGAARTPGSDEAWKQVAERAPRLSGGAGSALRARGVAPGARRLGTDPGGAAQRADKHLPEIAGLLDPAQFDLISRPGPGCLVVRGSAGSGKTTVALHRIAYLAYDEPRIDSPDTVFLTLSPALCDYVGTLLPSLGIGRVRVETFPEWAARHRRRLFPRLPTTHRIDTPDAVRRLKQHPAIGRVLAAQVARTPGPAAVEQALDDWASALTDAALLGTLLDPPLAAGDLRAAVDWCRVRQEELFAFLEGEEEAVAEIDAEDDALLLRAWQLRVGPIPAGAPGGGASSSARPASAPGALRYRHVAVDEAQDWAAIELHVVAGCLAEPASLTLAGDPHQRIASPFAAADWETLATELGLPSAEVETLRTSYRSTAEIMGFARAVLGPLWEDDAPPRAVRSGPPVEVFAFADSGACVAFLADALRQLVREEPLASVAILAPDADQAALYYDGLETSEVPRLRRVEAGRFAFAPGIEVAEIEQARGLEFDYVVLVDVSAASFADTPRSRRLFHVGATRAIHQLWVTHAGPGSPLLET
ncbi:MAG: ATP-binding domain-containing protein [Deltaproteobacteria bacterium]|nr:ATP-binding domain-containing protein [Deltaproteobacteria bacterium]